MTNCKNSACIGDVNGKLGTLVCNSTKDCSEDSFPSASGSGSHDIQLTSTIQASATTFSASKFYASGIATTTGQGYKRFLVHANYTSQDLQQLKPAANVSHFTSQSATVSSNTIITVPAKKGIKRVLVHDNSAISKPAKAVCVDSTVHVNDIK